MKMTSRKQHRVNRPRASAGAGATCVAGPAARLVIKDILVPIDFSDASKRALASAVPLAEQFGAKLTLLYVAEPVAVPEFAASLILENDKVMRAAKAKLDRLCEQAGINPALVGRTLARTGAPYHEITEAERSLKSDLIVISTHGYTGLKHVVLGSTTERVVRHAPCPVFVVRETGKQILCAPPAARSNRTVTAKTRDEAEPQQCKPFFI